jgi:hypothetical protein
MEIELSDKIDKRFEFLNINNKQIITLKLCNSTEDEYIATTLQIRNKVNESPAEKDIRFLADFQDVKFTPKMIYYSMQIAKYSSFKVSKRAAIGISPVAIALFRVARLNKPNTRIFSTYEEAIKFLSE